MASIVRIQNLEGPDSRWEPGLFHRVSPNQSGRETRAWRTVLGMGIQVMGEPSIRRTPGAPVTVTNVLSRYADLMEAFFDPYLLLAVIANESRGLQSSKRYEARISDWSFGLGQVLSGTAYGLLCEAKRPPPDKPITDGGNVEVWERYLCKPENNVVLVRNYLMKLNQRFNLKNDPILIYAAYNAGSPRVGATSSWGLVHHGPALDNLAAWYGDACYVVLNNTSPEGGVA
jgi:hypothetical protein